MNPAFPKARLRARAGRAARDAAPAARPAAGHRVEGVRSRCSGATHPYGHYSLGTEESVKATTPDDLAALPRPVLAPGDAELVVVGDVGEAELQAAPRADPRELEGRPPPRRRSRRCPPRRRTGPCSSRRPTRRSRTCSSACPACAARPTRTSPATVAFQVLGGGMASRLFRNLREEKGYTYGVYARGDARKLAGVSFVVGSVKADVTGPAIKEILLASSGGSARSPSRRQELEEAQGLARPRAPRRLRDRRRHRRPDRRPRRLRPARRLLEPVRRAGEAGDAPTTCSGSRTPTSTRRSSRS